MRKSGREMYAVVEARFALETGPKSGFKRVSIPYTFLKPDLASKLKPKIGFTCYFIYKHIGKAKSCNKLKPILAPILKPNPAQKKTKLRLVETDFCSSFEARTGFKKLHRNAPVGKKNTRPLAAKRRSWWQPPRSLFGRLLTVCWRGHAGRVARPRCCPGASFPSGL